MSARWRTVPWLSLTLLVLNVGFAILNVATGHAWGGLLNLSAALALAWSMSP